MTRNALIGAAAFGLTAAAAGYVWSAFEFPFAILLPAAIGWYAVTVSRFGRRSAYIAALTGGVTFTAAFLVGTFLALTDGSPFALSGWGTAVASAAVAGAATGWLLDRSHGAAAMAAFSAGGMAVATIAMGVLRAFAPATVDVPGLAQNLYLATALGMIGIVMGVALGAGTAWLASHKGWKRSSHSTIGHPSGT